MPPYDPNAPELLEENLRREREAYGALVGNNGRPCYPIQLGFEVLNNPGQYKDIFSYWRGEPGVHQRSPLIFSVQLERWKKFRQFQQKNRRYFVFHNRFPEFQQQVLERRRRHRLDGDVQLLEDRDKQSRLDDWMEYQDYELREYERLEKDFEEIHSRLASRRQALAEAGISAFEGIQELEFASYYSLALKCSGEEGKAEKREKLADRKLRLAEKKLKAADSGDLGERVERATWIALFLKEVESTQLRLDESQRLAENAKRELESYDRWFQAIYAEWREKRLEDPEEAEQWFMHERESAEYQDRNKKLDELKNKEIMAGSAHFTAKKEVEVAEEGYQAARLDNLGETVERAALIKVAQEELRSAQIQFEEARESTEKIELKGKVLSALSSIPLTRGKMKRHNVLLEWIEQQRREIAASCVPTQKKGGQGRPKRASLRALRNRPATEASRTNKPPKANGCIRKQSTTRSILSPVDPAKVSKRHGKRRSPRRKMSVPCDALQSTGKTNTDPSTPESRSKQAFKVKDTIPASLRPVHSSRVSKPGKKRPSGLSRDGTKLPLTNGTHWPKREYNLGLSSTPSTGRKAMQQPANASLRRSTRISKPPERFRPGFT